MVWNPPEGFPVLFCAFHKETPRHGLRAESEECDKPGVGPVVGSAPLPPRGHPFLLAPEDIPAGGQSADDELGPRFTGQRGLWRPGLLRRDRRLRRGASRCVACGVGVCVCVVRGADQSPLFRWALRVLLGSGPRPRPRWKLEVCFHGGVLLQHINWGVQGGPSPGSIRTSRGAHKALMFSSISAQLHGTMQAVRDLGTSSPVCRVPSSSCARPAPPAS